MQLFLAHYLFVLAAWTLVIKFLFPIAWDLAYGEALGTHIYRDFWWIAHIALGWALLREPPWLRPLAWGVTLAELVIVITRLALFLRAPEWTLWQTNWFVNKLFVLGAFVLMAVWLVRSGGRRKAPGP